MTRLKIVAIHLLISLALVGSILLAALLFWYPEDFLRTAELIAILWILAGVDATLGPLLTAIVFQPQKKSLKFDLAVIAVLQLSALIYGLSTIYIARPVFIVFNIDRLTVVSAVDIPTSKLTLASKKYQSFSFLGPQLVSARMPTEVQQQQEILFMSTGSGVDLAQLPQYYVNYSDMHSEINAKLQPLSELIKRKPETKILIETSLKKLGVSMQKVAFLPVIAQSNDAIAIIKRNNSEVLTYLQLDAWK